ncbi:hypothetical protein H9K76_00095 [Diaphorobacter ruginosibacter]|uniref:Zona occludens toxin N-terminal domain-containing protein n=1 Tax=Diaphorobacter ruginosibacter TaxID=1715720 RepID=A0A7G9RP24_9BURK|nr:zonular occludens toxin domain-containing protein [Diaphorobacter ruginosibacter]QNN56253.1 hypothetical protein H9K76_17075 [Diaphorobacter ruginosibacter]QNN57349.1 hypothetical protein H9K76_00095 [Diaphorobacter ruginosibacter]
MTDYAFVGKKGTGKSKHAVLRMRETYFKRKRAVATNLDIDLKAMFGPRSKVTYVRVPDKPTEFDLLAAGHGNPDSYDEDKNGAMVLDELGTWFNARTFNDKGRAGTLDFLAHARKHGWDCYYIMQDVSQVDKQLRDSFIEQTVRHVRYDKVRIPFVGTLIGMLLGDRFGYLPRFHQAVFRIGTNPQDLVSDRLWFKGQDIEPCYDTRQVFRLDYPYGTHSVLSPWHVEGRFLAGDEVPWWRKLLAILFKAKPQHVKPLAPLVPDLQLARVVKLARALPPDQSLQLVARYQRMRLSA